MGQGKLEHNSYFSIMEGKVCRQFPNPTDNTKTRVNKNGRTVHEELYDYIDGVITGITTKDSDFGRFWVIKLMDGGAKQILQLNYSSGYSNAFLKTLPNIDLNQKVCIIPKQDIQPDGKKKTTLFITQGGKAIKWYYTQKEPNGLPELIVTEGKGKMRGKKIYDDSEVMEFLEEMVMKDIVPNLPKGEPAPEDQRDEVPAKADGLKAVEEPDAEDEVESFNKKMDGKKSTATKAPVKKSAPAKKDDGKKKKKPF